MHVTNLFVKTDTETFFFNIIGLMFNVKSGLCCYNIAKFININIKNNNNK